MLGIEPLSAERQVLYLRALAKWSVPEIRYACNKAAEECRYPVMPIPGVLIDYARSMPRRQLRGDLNRPALDHTTSYNEKLADESIRAVMALFPDDFDRKSIPPRSEKQATAAEQRAALLETLEVANESISPGK